MAITRFYPPFYPDSREHMPMDKSARGSFVLYKDHEFRVKLLEVKIEKLEKELKEIDDCYNSLLGSGG